MGSSVQFKDKETTLKAYENRGVTVWSIFQGKQFMFKGKGLEELETLLDLLENQDQHAVYTLKVYEDLETDKGLKSSTPDDGSFNFRFSEPMVNVGNYASHNNNLILSKLSGIEERLNKLDQEESEHETGKSLGVIGEILEHPAIAPVAPMLIQKILEIVLGNSTPGKIMALPDAPGQKQSIAGIADREEEIKKCIDTLKKYDPKLLQHLQKLVAIAEHDKQTFDLIINALN